LRSILQVATSFCKAYFLPQGGAAEAATGREGVRDLTRFVPGFQIGRKSGENGGKNANNTEKIWRKRCEE
jgi:hypothetical protein